MIAEKTAFAEPPSVLPLVRKCHMFSGQSGNRFNPAIGHLVDLWGFHTNSPECLPPPETALFVAGPASWHQVAQRMGIRYVLLVDSEGTRHMIRAVAERFEPVDEDVEIELSPPLSGQPTESGYAG